MEAFKVGQKVMYLGEVVTIASFYGQDGVELSEWKPKTPFAKTQETGGYIDLKRCTPVAG